MRIHASPAPRRTSIVEQKRSARGRDGEPALQGFPLEAHDHLVAVPAPLHAEVVVRRMHRGAARIAV
ncbi:hypothetical protein GPA27_28810 [Aromatoleum toluolicum]|uniref:hypothetical protein n=1 Tax=Aromatoleum toluolicum TaxID=90060 RepID=UPI00210BFFF9|nr:hypothetical protein [Aromatoleum toluolicum]MCQ6963976.1 hypothetical protein [Aromatoleum toluolicum]